MEKRVIRLTESDLHTIVRTVLSEVINEKLGGFNYAGRGDEFYTRYGDIERELSGYNFNGDVVYCNCDDPSFSNFYKYFKQNFHNLGLRGLYATYYSDKPMVYYYDGKNETAKHIESGRFQDNAAIMRKCTVVVTNPPFSDSMPQELINMARNLGKDVIIIGPNTLGRRNDMFNMLKNGELNMGRTPINRFEKDGIEHTLPTSWWTTRNIERDDFLTKKTYSNGKYQKYDDYDAIECPKYSDIPDDYYGKMGVPWRFLRMLNRNQFDIIGKKKPKLNGKTLDTRLIIQRKRRGEP